MKCYINPITSIFGFFANLMSLAILVRSGLKKSSNILLFGLALADSMCMLMTVNIAEILSYFDPAKSNPKYCCWQYDYIVAYILYMLFTAAYFIGGWGCYTNSFIPVFVTAERLAAVFWPITFSRKITKTTAAVWVISAFMFWLPYCTLYLCIYSFEYVNISNILIGGRTHASFLKDFDIDSLYLLDSYVFEALSSWVPFSFVIVGCYLH